jgi:cutinase
MITDSRRRAFRLGSPVLAAAVATLAALLSGPAQVASAQACPDVEVVFARGTGEPPGVGGVGGAFVNAVRGRVGGRSVGVYGVNYPASGAFGSPGFRLTFTNGIGDERGHIQSMAGSCPNTRMVIGGYSQGAALTGDMTSGGVSPDAANHVAAVALFGKPSANWMRTFGNPPVGIGPQFAGKTIDLCAPGDNICDGAPGGPPNRAHGAYPFNGMVGQAADFAAGRL